MSTPDLIVMEFRRGCGQMDLASACVLRPLELLGPVFQDGRGDGMNERRSGVYRVVLYVGIQYGCYIKMVKRRIILFAHLFPEVILLFLGNYGRLPAE